MKRYGPDSLTSWVIACACCFNNIIMSGMIRICGILFVESIPIFNVSKKEASFPYTFAVFVRSVSGPLAGYLGHRCGVRVVTTFGCILSAIGAGTCFFAQTIDTVTILWGVLVGLGLGFGNILLPVTINQYFDKYRSTASSISFSGSCIGSFILPPALELILNNYGLSGTYLFLAGFFLNCIPAALILTKPNFVIKRTQDFGNCDKQIITTGKSLELNFVEDDSQKHVADDNQTVSSKPNANVPCIGKHQRLELTHTGNIRNLSPQDLLSESSLGATSFKFLNAGQITKNNEFKRKIDPMVLEVEDSSLFLKNTVLKCDRDEVFEKSFHSSSVRHKKETTIDDLKRIQVSSSENERDSIRRFTIQKYRNSYQTHDYEKDLQVLSKNNVSSFQNSDIHYIQDNPYSKSLDMSDEYIKSYQSCSGFKKVSEKYKQNTSKKFNFSGICNYTKRHGKLSIFQENFKYKVKQTSSLETFRVILDPMFLLIAINTAIYVFTSFAMTTIIVDFARDLNIGISNIKYILMTFSVGELIGRVSLGWITDCGYMTTTNFTALCFACQAIAAVSTVWTNGFMTIMITITLYGISGASIMVMFPIIIAQHIDQDKQTMAITASHFPAGPVCLAIAPVIGYFRDGMGSYDYIFYGLGILLLLCSFSWILAPCIARCRKEH